MNSLQLLIQLAKVASFSSAEKEEEDMTIKCEKCSHKFVCKNKELYEKITDAVSSKMYASEFTIGGSDGPIKKLTIDDVPFFELELNCDYYTKA